jgi:hypothetical protein
MRYEIISYLLEGTLSSLELGATLFQGADILLFLCFFSKWIITSCLNIQTRLNLLDVIAAGDFVSLKISYRNVTLKII